MAIKRPFLEKEQSASPCSVGHFPVARLAAEQPSDLGVAKAPEGRANALTAEAVPQQNSTSSVAAEKTSPAAVQTTNKAGAGHVS